MAVQSSITEYFNSRKRPAIDDVKKIGQPCKKVMILENLKSDVSDRPEFSRSKEESPGNAQPTVRRKLIYLEKQNDILKQKIRIKSIGKSKNDSSDRIKINHKSSGRKQLDIRKTFSVLNRPAVTFQKGDNPIAEVNKSGVEDKIPADDYVTPKKNVSPDVVELHPVNEGDPCSLEDKDMSSHFLYEKETNLDDLSEKETNLPEKEDLGVAEKETDSCILSEQELKTPVKESSKTVPCEEKLMKKELNVQEIKSRLQKSSRLPEIKAALSKLNDGFSKLEKLREKRISSEKPSIKKFDTVSFDVLVSPPKTPAKKASSSGMSPAKLREAVFKSPGRTVKMESVYISPRKLVDMQSEPVPPSSPTKPPAFQRYQALISEGRSALILPFKYRSLAEIFRGIETVVSMMHNRGETVTFTKLKNAVQELLRRNLNEKHLGQVKTVFGDAFEITYEKTPCVGKQHPEKYDLVVKPILKKTNLKTAEDTSPSETCVTKLEMTPDVLLERRRIFYNNLLIKTKLYHEEFLLSLDPPIHVNQDMITRWHPEFDVDGVPDMEASPLPEPPNVQKVATAKDVLERARNLFGTNPRLDNAMRKLTERKNESNNPPSESVTTNTGPAVAALTNALKGIPKSLLEKVRAKQAAKALEAMTRSPSQAKEAVRLTRLPEIARIVRNIFVSEKKSVLTRELIVKKLADSYRENLSSSELNIHLDLLQEKTPEWLSFCILRKTNFVKFVKDADMSRIMTRLESIASENNY